MQPILDEFATLWPDAEVLNILDESLYADVDKEGRMRSDVPERIGTLLKHAVSSRGEAIVFTGSTFGPAVDLAKSDITVPVLKADQAMAEMAARLAAPTLLVCTAPRAVPVISSNLHSVDAELDLEVLTVPDAKDAIERGDIDGHDKIIADAISERGFQGTVLLGQVSMGGVRARLPKSSHGRVLFSATCTVQRLRDIFQ